MSQVITLPIKMFGAFRKYHQGSLEISIPVGSTATELKATLAATLRQRNPAFNDDELIGKSVLADSQRVLGADEAITAPLALAILPPVCGG